MQLSCFQIKSRFFSYFLGLRKRPGAVFGICLTVVAFAISLTIFISTLIYWNSVKKSRIQSQGKIRKIIRRPVPWMKLALSSSAQQNCCFYSVVPRNCSNSFSKDFVVEHSCVCKRVQEHKINCPLNISPCYDSRLTLWNPNHNQNEHISSGF